MAKDRAQDRHQKPGYIYRPDPSDLLERVDALHGKRQRSRVLSDLLRRYLAGHGMPAPGDACRESDESGQDAWG